MHADIAPARLSQISHALLSCWAGASGGAGARQQQQQPALAPERRRGSHRLPWPQPALRLLSGASQHCAAAAVCSFCAGGLIDVVGRCTWRARYLCLFERGMAGCCAGRLYLLRVLSASASVAQDVGQSELHERFSCRVCKSVFFHRAQLTKLQCLDAKTSRCCQCKQQHSCMSVHSEYAAPLSSASKQIHNRMACMSSSHCKCCVICLNCRTGKIHSCMLSRPIEGHARAQ